MELRVYNASFPEAIEFNFEEIKTQLAEKVSFYNGLVYSEDQVKEAKKDLANLRKFAKALSDERIKVKKQYLKPYEAFEAKVKELAAIVEEPVQLIDKQVKAYEEQKREEKLQAIRAFWDSLTLPFPIDFDRVMDGRWLNASISMPSITGALEVFVDSTNRDLKIIDALPEFSFEAKEVYMETLDLPKAIEEGKRLAEMAKRKAEAERARAEAKLLAAQEPEAPEEPAKEEPALAEPVEEPEQMPVFTETAEDDDDLPVFDPVQKQNYLLAITAYPGELAMVQSFLAEIGVEYKVV